MTELPAKEFREDFKKFMRHLDENLSNDPKSESYWKVMGEKTRKTLEIVKSVQASDLWKKSKKYKAIIVTSNLSLLKDYEEGDDWLALAIFCCYPAFQRVSKTSDSKIWKEELIGKTREIIELINNAPDEYNRVRNVFFNRIFEKVITSMELDESSVTLAAIEKLGLDSIIDILKLFSHFVDEMEPDNRFWTSRKTSGKEKATNPKRAYFIRALTKAFIDRTGTPQRENVRCIANILFTGNISTKQIIELTRDIIEAPSDFQNPVKFAYVNILESVSDYPYS